MNHRQPHGSTTCIGIVSSKYIILGKRAHRDISAIDMVIKYAPSPVVLQALGTELSLFAHWQAELKMVLPLPVPT